MEISINMHFIPKEGLCTILYLVFIYVCAMSYHVCLYMCACNLLTCVCILYFLKFDLLTCCPNNCRGHLGSLGLTLKEMVKGHLTTEKRKRKKKRVKWVISSYMKHI